MDGATTRVVVYPVPAGAGTYIVYPNLRITGTTVLQLSSSSTDDVVVTTLTYFYAGPPDRAGLVLGYGGLTTEQIVRGAAVIVAAVRQENRR